MRVVFYTHPFFLEPALHFSKELARLAEVHLYLEVAPASLGSLLATTPVGLPAGIHDGNAVLGRMFPPGVHRYWDNLASFNVVVYGHRRTVDARTVPMSVRALRHIDAIRPDIVHLDDGSLRLAMALPGVPPIAVLNVHDPVPHPGDANRHIELARRAMARKVRRYRVHGERLRAPFAAKARVDPSRVDAVLLGAYSIFREWAAGGLERDPRTILFAGRLASYKGLDVLYRAAPIVARAVPGVTFVVAGRAVAGYLPPSPPELPNGGRVRLVDGHISNEHLAALHQRATVVVCPYTAGTQSGVLLTAYGFGTPVVATDVGALAEYVDDGKSGLLVQPHDHEMLANALLRVLTDGPLRNDLSEGVRSVSEGRLAWSAIAESVINCYGASAAP